jgi:hypothetical protein
MTASRSAILPVIRGRGTMRVIAALAMRRTMSLQQIKRDYGTTHASILASFRFLERKGLAKNHNYGGSRGWVCSLNHHHPLARHLIAFGRAIHEIHFGHLRPPDRKGRMRGVAKVEESAATAIDCTLFDRSMHGPVLQFLEAAGECPVHIVCDAVGVSRPGMEVLMRRYERYGILSSKIVVVDKLIRLVSLNKRYAGYTRLRTLLHTLNHFSPQYRAMARVIEERCLEWRRGRTPRRFNDPGEGG